MAQTKSKGKSTQQRRDQQGGSQRSSRQGVQKYGVICRNGESHVLKKMGVSEDNIIGVSALKDLMIVFNTNGIRKKVIKLGLVWVFGSIRTVLIRAFFGGGGDARIRSKTFHVL